MLCKQVEAEEFPTWWKVGAGVCIMTGVTMLALTMWAGASLLDWVTSK